MKDALKGKVVVVTGASSGLGHAIAQEAAAQGARLLLAARRLERLEALASRLGRGNDVRVLQVDVSREADSERLVEEAEQAFGGIDLLILNAGAVGHGTVVETSMSEARYLMEVNYFGPLASIRRAVPGMRSRPGSHVVVVSSYCAYTHMPLAGAYSASKAAVASLARVLSTEGPPPPYVTVVYPGVIRTEMFDRVQSSVPVMERFRKTGMDADVAARKVLKAVRRRKPALFLTRPAIVMDGLMRLAPNTVDRTTRLIFTRIPERLLSPPGDGQAVPRSDAKE